MSARSAIPWSVGEQPSVDYDDDCRAVMYQSKHAGPLTVCIADAPDAEFIVRACNSHDALVAALEEMLSPSGTGEARFTKARAALSAAKGTS